MCAQMAPSGECLREGLVQLFPAA